MFMYQEVNDPRLAALIRDRIQSSPGIEFIDEILERRFSDIPMGIWGSGAYGGIYEDLVGKRLH